MSLDVVDFDENRAGAGDEGGGYAAGNSVLGMFIRGLHAVC